jgi:hypothetical protein
VPAVIVYLVLAMGTWPDEVDPATLVRARYSLPDGSWLALPSEPWDSPHEIFDDDNIAYGWYEYAGLQFFDGRYGGKTANVPVGVGKTPEEAYEDLIVQLRGMEPVRRWDPTLNGGFIWQYEVVWPGGRSSTVELSHPGEPGSWRSRI